MMRRLFLALFLLLAAALPALAQVAADQVNPGDMVQVVLPGEDAFAQPIQVDREGRLLLPEVGPVEIGGLTVPEARERVRAALAQSFRDLSRFNLILRERRLVLNVLGFVRNPGPVELPWGANVQQAVVAAGGLTSGAQMDRMQLRRGREVTTFDYRRYLDTGDPDILPRLAPLDTIFVPASPLAGAVQTEFDPRAAASAADTATDRTAVRVFGEVNGPGAFPHREGMRVMDAILRAGGPTRYAGTEQVRVIIGTDPRLFNLRGFLDTGNPAQNPEIPPGTTVFVPAASEEVRQGPRTVYVMGEVQRAGAYEIRSDATFFDILANAGGPTRFAETRQVRIIRADGRNVEPFDLGGFLEGRGGTAPSVRPGDAIFVPEKTQGPEQASWLRVPPGRSVRVMGAVRAPGRFEFSDEMSLLDVLAQAGGPSERADLSRLRIVVSDTGPSSTFDLQRFMERGGRASSLPRIRGNYTIMVPEQPAHPTDTRAQWLLQPPERSIYVLGAVGRPGRYAFDQNLSFIDIVAAADGPTTTADLTGIRVTHNGERRNRISRVNMAQYLESGDRSLLPRVRPGDVIFVPDRNRNWLEQPAGNTIRVLGAVGRPGRYPFNDGMTLLDLLAEAGGPNRDALQERIVVVNMSCCSDQARLFNLPRFARTGDMSMLPVVRAGDTVYVPDSRQSEWRQFFDGVRDVVVMLSVVALLGRM